MNENEIPNSEDGNPFLSLADHIGRRLTRVSILATAIETEGVYCWDRFGRFIKAEPGSEYANKALDLLAQAFSLMQDPQPYRDEQYSDYEEALRDSWDHPLYLYGWASAVAPNFDFLQKEDVSPPRPVSRRDAQLEHIRHEIERAGYEPMAIPRGGKARIRKNCLNHPDVFTDSGFDHAWRKGVAYGLFKMRDAEKYSAK